MIIIIYPRISPIGVKDYSRGICKIIPAAGYFPVKIGQLSNYFFDAPNAKTMIFVTNMRFLIEQFMLSHISDLFDGDN